MFQSIDVGADMIAQYRHRTGRQRCHAMLGGADAFGELLPIFVHEQHRTYHAAVRDGLLDERCERIFRRDKATGNHALRLHHHQRAAIEIAADEQNYVLTTGTGSGKSLAYIVPIVDHVLRRGSGRGIQAIIVYPMNALVNSQEEELKKFLHEGFAPHEIEVSFDRYTGQEGDETRQRIVANPPDILLTNYVMLELMMTRPYERKLIERAKGLRFLVLDELHTYRGRQGADVALLMRRARNRVETPEQTIQFVGTSATLAGEGTLERQQKEVAEVASEIFGSSVKPEHVIGETLKRATPRKHDPAAVRGAMTDRAELVPPQTYAEYVQHPVSMWIEDTFGLARKRRDAGCVRSQAACKRQRRSCKALPVSQQETCAEVIQAWLSGRL